MPIDDDLTSGISGEDLVNFRVDFEGVDQSQFDDFSIKEIVLSESLLAPSLQTSVKVQSYRNNIPLKIYELFYNAPLSIDIEKPSLANFNMNTSMSVRQKTYRLGGRSSTRANDTDDRKLINRTVEELTFHGCDQTLLNDAGNLVSRSWKCTTPSVIANEVLRSCAGASKINIEHSDPAYDYIAENIHPFQVVAQQTNAALAAGNDPSFVHFMTYENEGTHHFRSLHKMAQQKPIIELLYSNTGKSYSVPYSIMHYTFPCDFDLLSDILNGVHENVNSLALVNLATKGFSLFGHQTIGCGVGGGPFKLAMTNQGSEKQQGMCPDHRAKYILLRQARMGLLDKDKIGLRLVVPWNPMFNVGKVLEIKLYNDEDESRSTLNYGSGNYLISSLIHNIKSGGYGVTIMDCVASTVAGGQV
jgi:hypothetical protein